MLNLWRMYHFGSATRFDFHWFGMFQRSYRFIVQNFGRSIEMQCFFHTPNFISSFVSFRNLYNY